MKDKPTNLPASVAARLRNIGVVDGGVRGEEALSGAGGFEPLHLALPSSHRLVRVHLAADLAGLADR